MNFFIRIAWSFHLSLKREGPKFLAMTLVGGQSGFRVWKRSTCGQATRHESWIKVEQVLFFGSLISDNLAACARFLPNTHHCGQETCANPSSGTCPSLDSNQRSISVVLFVAYETLASNGDSSFFPCPWDMGHRVFLSTIIWEPSYSYFDFLKK